MLLLEPQTSFNLGQQDTWEESRDYRDEDEPPRRSSNQGSPGKTTSTSKSPNERERESSLFGIGKGIFSNGSMGVPSPSRNPSTTTAAVTSPFASSPTAAATAATAAAEAAARSPPPEVKKAAPSLFGMFSPRTPSLISHPASLTSLNTVTDSYVRTSSTQSALESAKLKALASDSHKRIDTSGILARDGLEIAESGNKVKVVSADSLDDGVSDDVSSTGESEDKAAAHSLSIRNNAHANAHSNSNYRSNTNASLLKDPSHLSQNNNNNNSFNMNNNSMNNSLADVSALNGTASNLSLRPLDNTLSHIMNDTNNSNSDLKALNDSYGSNSEGHDILTNMSNLSFNPSNAAYLNDGTNTSIGSQSPSNPNSPCNKGGRITSYKMPPLTEQNSFNQRKSDMEVYYLGILYKKNSTGRILSLTLLLRQFAC